MEDNTVAELFDKGYGIPPEFISNWFWGVSVPSLILLLILLLIVGTIKFFLDRHYTE